MRTLVESLRRLYVTNSVTREKIETLLSQGKIIKVEYDKIVGG